MDNNKPIRSPLRLVIADDHQLFADGIEQLVSTLEDVTVTGKVQDGRSLMRLLNSQLPDIILMDINMPRMDGIVATREIRHLFPSVKIIFITMYYDPNILTLCKELRVNGYLTKDTTADIMKQAIGSVAAGKTIYLEKERQEGARTGLPDDDFIRKFKLSPKELEIIRQVRDGLSSKTIADNLGLKETTIETHRKNIYRKLQVRSVGELIRFAYEQNI